MKSLTALIWSCCISMLPSPFFLLSLHARTICLLSVPLLLCMWFSSLFSLWALTGVILVLFSHSPVALMLIYPLLHSVCHASSSASWSLAPVPPLLQGAVMFFLYQLLTEMLLFFCYCWWCLNLTAWYSNNVMKFNIYCTMIKLKVMHNFNK